MSNYHVADSIPHEVHVLYAVFFLKQSEDRSMLLEVKVS